MPKIGTKGTSEIRVSILQIVLFLCTGFLLEINTLNQNFFGPESVALLVMILFIIWILLLDSKILHIVFGISIIVVSSVSIFEEFWPAKYHRGSATKAISYNVFSGGSNSNQLFAWLLACFTLGGLLLVFRKSADKFKGNAMGSSLGKPATERSQNFFTSDRFLFLIFFLTATPSFTSLLAKLKAPSQNSNFDATQMLSWQILKSNGLIPIRDFWYPYGQMIFLFDGIFGAIAVWILTVGVMYSINFVAKVFGVSFWQRLIFGLVLVFAININWYYAVRYLIPVVATILFVCVLDDVGLPKLESLFLGLLPALVIWLSPENAIVSLFLIFVFCLFKVLTRKAISIRSNAYFLLLPCLSYVLYFIYLLKTDSLMNSFRFLASSDELIQYTTNSNFYTMPTEALASKYALVFYGLLISFLCLLSLTIFRTFSSRSIGADFLAICIISVFVLLEWQKELIRGGMLMGLIFSTSVVMFIHPLRLNSRRVASFILPCFALSVIFFSSTLGSSMVYRALSAPSEVKFLLSTYANGEFQKYFFNSDFAAIKNSDQEVIQVEDFVRKNGLDLGNLLVVGDRSSFYWKRSKPIWTITNWNSSPIDAQEKFLRILKESNYPPIYVDTRPSTLGFDGIPATIRLPLIFKFLYENYSAEFLTGEGAVMLRQRNSLEVSSSNKDFWDLRIGRTLDTGYISQVTSRREGCASLENCETFVYFSNSTDAPKGQAVDISCKSGDFKLLLSTKSVDAYFPVGRIWFWDSSCLIKQGTGGDIQLVRGIKRPVLY